MDEPPIQRGRQFSDWHWSISPQNLEDAIEFACSTQFLVTMSTVKSGASEPLNVHFQGVPRFVEWNNAQCELFGSLLRSLSSSDNFGRQRSNTLQVSTQIYPAFVAKIAGQKRNVCEKALTLCLGYDSLRAFNMIIAKLDEKEVQDGKEVAIYWFPRRFDGQVIPSGYEQNRWAFGSFEMGGVFLTGDANLYNGLSWAALSQALQNVSIQRQSPEECVIANLLRFP